ncbi:phosphotransferase [Halioglobus maricola]|nr:phosphotransferase [Halioglobus maricola]
MGIQHIQQLCDVMGLGYMTQAPTAVAGGFHHAMWCVDTAGGRHAIKQLAADVDLGNPTVVSRYNASERTAQTFAALGVPALSAIEHDGYFLQQFDNSGYLVYPWASATARGRNQIKPGHAETVATILAEMHQANIQVPELPDELPKIITAEDTIALIEFAVSRNVHEARYLQERIDDVLAVLAALDEALPLLATHHVISHGDLDHKNVLWNDAGKPLLIDWESAMHLNPTYETLLEALDWSGITAHFDTHPFADFLASYGEAGGVLEERFVPAALDTVLAAWLHWLMYNLGRAMGLDDSRQRRLGTEQVDLALAVLLRLEKFLPRLRDIAITAANRGPHV